MASEDAAPSSITDFFAKKQQGKKKPKAVNLNVQKDATKPDEKKKGKKDADEDGWEEEQVVASTMRGVVEVKQLLREDEKKEEDEVSAPAWGNIRNKEASNKANLNEKKYPSLAKSMMHSSNINIDDGRDAKINIETSKNLFSALENEAASDDDSPKRPREIKPAMVQKKKGETQKDAVAREVKKYAVSKKQEKKKKKEADSDSEESGSSSSEESSTDEEAEARKKEEAKKEREAEKKRKMKEDKKKAEEKVVEQEEDEEEEEMPEDTKIVPDLSAIKDKYTDRRKPFPAKALPPSELRDKENIKPSAKTASVSKKKKCAVNEEDFEKKIPVWVDN